MKISTVLPVDTAEVVALERSLESGWSVASVSREFYRPLGVQLIARGDGAGVVIGWCCGLLIGAEAELLRIAVSQSERRRGVGAALLSKFAGECRERRVTSIFLEVAETNMPARRLYEKFSYSEVGRRKGYYSQPVDDALVMKKTLFPQYSIL